MRSWTQGGEFLSCAFSQGLSTTHSLGKTRAEEEQRGRRRTLLLPPIRRWRQRIWRNYINTTPDTFLLLPQWRRENSTGTDVRPKARRLPPSGSFQCQNCEYMIGLRGGSCACFPAAGPLLPPWSNRTSLAPQKKRNLSFFTLKLLLLHTKSNGVFR